MSTPKASEPPAKRRPVLIEDDLDSLHSFDGVPSPTWVSSEPLVSGQPIGAGQSAADTRTPRIVILDSLHDSHSRTCKTLKNYLENEARDKKGIGLSFLPG